jgi:hypothetical protein
VDWGGLGLNLLSEAIGIAFTLFGVDKLIQYRHNRRWQEVHGFFWKIVWEECGRLNAAFAVWLTRLSNHVSVVHKRQQSVQASPDPEAPDRGMHKRSAYSGLQPFGYDFAQFAGLANRQQIVLFLNEFIEVLGPVLNSEGVRVDALWQELASALALPLTRLEQLIVTNASLIEPGLAFAVLSLTRDLQHLRRGADPYNHISANASLTEWSDHIDLSMQSALAAVLKLNLAARGKAVAARRRWWDQGGRIRRCITNMRNRLDLFKRKQRNG